MFLFRKDVGVTLKGYPLGSKFVKLNLNGNLSDIRKQLENDKIIDETLSISFSRDGIIEIQREHDEKFRLSEVIERGTDESEYILHLMRSNTPNWRLFNNKCRLDYGCTMTNEDIK